MAEIGPALPAPETASAAASGGDANCGKFLCQVPGWSTIRDKRWHSEAFSVGGYKWRLLMFPKGNGCEHLSVYLDVADADALSVGWTRAANFSLTVLSDHDAKFNVRKETSHTFNAREPDWGFTQFLLLSELQDPVKGFLAGDTLKIECDVVIKKELYSFASYDSKKETGYIGFKNQGATCYMNSLLQTLYHIPYFRKAVYHMPTTENDAPEKSIPLALQSLFYKMQFQDTSVGTKELTKSFGWDQLDSFTQHDVQELNRVLCEKLEDKMKGTAVEGTIQRLFEGHHLSYVECIGIDFKSNRKETFQDIQLDVKGCKDVYASFDKYVEVEKLEGQNQYHADGHGLQDARKGVWFLDFPPVLELHLRRFDYDFQRDTMVKINDRYEFPAEMDLDKYLAPDADRSVRNHYTLHSVLVHSGGVHGGHYYAYIRPSLAGDGQWFKFDDERVTKEETGKAIDDQFGGEDESPQPTPGAYNNMPSFKFTKYSNAYMLVYIRTCDKDRIVCEVSEEDIAEHLRLRLKREAEEKARKKKEKEDAHLYTVVKVATDEDMKKQIGTDIYFDLVDHEKVKHFRIEKIKPFTVVKEQIQEQFGIPVACQRFWIWAKRQNHTYRPNRPLTAQEEQYTLTQLRETVVTKSAGHNAQQDLRLFLDTSFPLADPPLPPPEIRKGDILLFLKLYDAETETLRYAGRKFEPVASLVGSLKEYCNSLAGFPPNTELVFFEEIKSEPDIMCEVIDKKMSLKACQLEDGDIVCFQRAPEPKRFKRPTVPEFLSYVKNRQVVNFRELEKPKDAGFTLEMLKHNSYEEVTSRLAEQLKVADPSTIRLTAHNVYSHMPKPQPMKYKGVDKLHEMITQYNQVTDILYYEVLDMPVHELERLKVLKVAFNNAKTEEVGTYNIRLPRESTVSDVLTELRKQLGEKGSPTGELRMLEVFYSKIYKVFPGTDKIDSINESYWHLRAEEVPEEQKNVEQNERLIHVYHFNQTQNSALHNFGDPFLLKIRDDEQMTEIKRRIQAKLGVSEEDFAKWKFAYVASSRPELLEDADILAARFNRRDYGAYENYLGLEHEDKHPKRSNNNNRFAFEKAVKIWN